MDCDRCLCRKRLEGGAFFRQVRRGRVLTRSVRGRAFTPVRWYCGDCLRFTSHGEWVATYLGRKFTGAFYGTTTHDDPKEEE